MSIDVRNGFKAMAGIAALLLALAGALALLGATASPASAAPAVCSQYPDLPECSGGAGGTDDPSGTSLGGDGQATGDIGATAELPFTGYPLTPLILLLLVLLLCGLAIRAYLAARDRVTEPRRSGGPPSDPL